jgi:hypothetical protein
MKAWLQSDGQIAIQPTPDGLAPGYTSLPDPPSASAKWDSVNETWTEVGPREWELRAFLRDILTPMEFLQIKQWVPASLPPTPSDLTFLWAREMVLALSLINLEDPNTSAMLTMCVERGLLTSNRAQRILAGLPPT